MSKYMHTLSPYDKRPCESCEFLTMCSKHDVVCEAYYRYACGRRWKGLKQIPDVEHYQRLFSMNEVTYDTE